MVTRINVTPGWQAWVREQGDELRDRTLEDVAEDARRYCPVDTGELLASIHVEDNKVVADADHAAYVELGTRDTRAQPYLRPATYKKRG